MGTETPVSTETPTQPPSDLDGDGVLAPADCDDGDALTYPGALEGCDGKDNDCDGMPDDGAGDWYYADEDQDGARGGDALLQSCQPVPGMLQETAPLDCNDAEALVYPDAAEVCDNLDNDCNGLVDDDAQDAIAFYADADGDAFGVGAPVYFCTLPEGFAALADDCDDGAATTYPGANEPCDGADNDCDGTIDEEGASTWYVDSDGDGFGTEAGYLGCEAQPGYAAAPGDCAADNPNIYPGAEEVCDGADNDCDGEQDESGGPMWYLDGDGDGAGDPSQALASCEKPDGYVVSADDCDDSLSSVAPGLAEVCDGLDNDCDGAVDEGTLLTFYADADQDGAGDPQAPTVACEAPTGHVTEANDCNDEVSSIHPGASETCDSIDQDCDGLVDNDALDASLWYADADGDGFGDAGVWLAACLVPIGYGTDASDCNDAAPDVFPGAEEVCDGVDQDCNGLTDEDAIDAPLWYLDLDSDGYSGSDQTVYDCQQPTNGNAVVTDCDDAVSEVNPSAAELCDGFDNNCDGQVDEATAVDAPTWYADLDGDGVGGTDSTQPSCTQPVGFLPAAGDCDDQAAEVYPGAVETCNGVDDNCLEGADEPSAVDAGTWYADQDQDGYGGPESPVPACAQPLGYLSSSSDCNDAAADVNPAGLEVCDGVDNNCDGQTDEADAWWNPAWPYRVSLQVKASSATVSSPPVAVDVDFRALLDELGDASALEGESLRVVLADCSLGQPELPSQFLDEWTRLMEKADDADPVGDEAGTLAFLADTNGSYASLEPLPGGSILRYDVYFGSDDHLVGASVPAYSTGLSATSSQLKSGVSTASFNASAGGMLDNLTLPGSPRLMSQTISCCGNSPHIQGWNVDPQDGAGTLTLLEDGPVLGIVEATGSRSVSGGAYRYSYTYWMFAGRPELWSKVYEVTTATTTFDHAGDYTSGIRPWESQQPEVAASGTFVSDPAYFYADVSNGTWGVSWGYARPPKYVVGLSMYNPYLIVIGNDIGVAGTGTPRTVPAGTAFLENVVQVVLPHTGTYTSVQSTLLGLRTGVTVTTQAAEPRPNL